MSASVASLALGLGGMLVSLGLLIWLAYRGWTVLLLAPLCAMLAASISGEPVLAHWTQTFMLSTGRFLAQFFPLFLLGSLFGKLMEDSGSVDAVARLMIDKLGNRRALVAVVLGGALVTYGGVSLFVAFFVLAPMAQALFRSANIPRRLMPAAIMLGTSTFTMSALPGTPALQNAIPMPFFGTTPFAAPGLGVIASVVMAGFGLWWLGRAAAAAKRNGEGFVEPAAAAGDADAVPDDGRSPLVRERASVAQTFDPAEIGDTPRESGPADGPPALIALIPLVVVIVTNFVMNVVVFPQLDASYLEEPQWGPTSLSAVAGVWGVSVALALGIVVLVALNRGRLPDLRGSVDAGANASVLPVLSVGSLVGYGAVIAALPAFEVVREWVLGIGGGPLVSLAVATNLLSGLTGSASGGLTIALDALGDTYMQLAAQQGIDPALLHRVAVMSAGTLDSLPHNGAVVTLLAVCGSTHRESYGDLVVVSIVGALIALAVVIVLGSLFGSF
ncbi:GntP family permease [Paraburkholderia caballeronis]|uniref:H+/gluconate symporter n=1 Tax=Paraburkholderia caballeronis TaxID=416943 RepID=A0A1H7SCS3_9BURK|nr:GntP family permease [Paraburkholderia caballeronis]PXW22975.1 H+/gluconate symporter-like permease [Paraburkholderia caballeronis]PXW97360.1 H+/gluconate symporter-like permease [Paraburkholderia caballeronis]RAJ93880.1 H+/gluconate symporter-like permease [Paraburkholderia caballeronis]TDV38932.1 H+/gluconate symporter-like permease [Paraburkholderia caballeronis]SED53953.1 H+/gluconate symporter [Paraburkholderia caballeronis]